MDKKYKDLEFICGHTLSECVLELVTYATKGEFVKGSFNGHILYSDNVSMDSAYQEICGKGYFETMNQREIKRQELKEEEKTYQETVPENTKIWIKYGHSVLDKKYWKEWDKCVPVRLSDLYHGMELGSCIEIIKCLNANESLQNAKEIIDSQDHSGLSYGLVKNMVRTFCDRGSEFADYIE